MQYNLPDKVVKDNDRGVLLALHDYVTRQMWDEKYNLKLKSKCQKQTN